MQETNALANENQIANQTAQNFDDYEDEYEIKLDKPIVQ